MSKRLSLTMPPSKELKSKFRKFQHKRESSSSRLTSVQSVPTSLSQEEELTETSLLLLMLPSLLPVVSPDQSLPLTELVVITSSFQVLSQPSEVMSSLTEVSVLLVVSSLDLASEDLQLESVLVPVSEDSVVSPEDSEVSQESEVSQDSEVSQLLEVSTDVAMPLPTDGEQNFYHYHLLFSDIDLLVTYTHT